MYKITIVGAGLSGITAARILADAGNDVTIFETRSHIGGNCFDSNIAGTTVHNYGPHIFHTNDEEVFAFLSRFTEWIPFELQPKGRTVLGVVSLPYSKKTIGELGRPLSDEEIRNYLFVDYSEKQWGVPFESIPKTITNRIPKTKDCENPTWFEGEKYQCIPKHGYTKMFEKMLEGIPVKLSAKPNEWKERDADFVIYTGSIDSFFNYCFGRLPYRTLEFEHKVTSKGRPYFIENQNNSHAPFTRCYDHSYFDPDHSGVTVVTKEYSKQCGDKDIPFYPIPWGEGQKIYNQYKELADKQENYIFLGRLATYKYLDMWMAIKQVMIVLKRFLNERAKSDNI